MSDGERVRRGAPHVLTVRDDGLILGSDAYEGQAVIAARWTPDARELRRRIKRALLPALPAPDEPPAK